MKKALLLIDIQNDYFVGGSNALFKPESAATQAQRLLTQFRENGESIVHIQHIANRPTASFFLPNTRGAEIHESVKPLSTEKVIVKHLPNSFRETELLEYLRHEGIEHLIICGMMTHMCIDATTRAAKDLGFECTLVGDACATKSLEIGGESVAAEEVQKSFLAALNYFYASVTTADAYLKNS